VSPRTLSIVIIVVLCSVALAASLIAVSGGPGVSRQEEADTAGAEAFARDALVATGSGGEGAGQVGIEVQATTDGRWLVTTQEAKGPVTLTLIRSGDGFSIIDVTGPVSGYKRFRLLRFRG
jgi:hypothetical protein